MRDYTIDSLKTSLKSSIPEPKMLEMKSILIIPQKNTTIGNIFIRPSAAINSLKMEIEEHFIKTGNPIQNIDPKKVYLVFVPPEKKLSNHKLLNEGSVLTDEAELKVYVEKLGVQGFARMSLASEELFLKHNLKQSGVFYVYGTFKLKDEAVIECLTYKYENGKTTDYFSCSECGINCKIHIFYYLF